MVDVHDDEWVYKSQGMIAGEILVPEACVGGDDDLVEEAAGFVNWAIWQAHLGGGEIVPEVLWSGNADYYFGQVNNGGHSQFASNSEMNALTIDGIRRGLAAMGASDYSAIFEAFMAIMTSGPERVKSILEGFDAGKIDPDMLQLDDRFFALNNMRQLNAAWLRSLPSLRPLPPDQLNAAREALIASNTQHGIRAELGRKITESSQATDPTQVAARATCAQEGVTFEGLTAGTPAANGNIFWGLRTSGGPRVLHMFATAAQMRAEFSLRGQYFFATKCDYPEAVGDGTVRRRVMAAPSADIRRQIQEAADDNHAASPPQSREALLMTAVMAPLLDFVEFLTAHSSAAGAAIVLPYVGDKPFHATYVPRAASPHFAQSDEQSLFRLVVANALWDSAIASDAVKNVTAGDPDRVAALLINLGAAAATAASQLRLFDVDRVAALSLRSSGDSLRETLNVKFQLIEIVRWWLEFIRMAVPIYQHTKFTARPWLFTNVCRNNAWALADLLRPDATARLADALAYFDREYPPVPETQPHTIYDRALETYANQFAGSRRAATVWVEFVRDMAPLAASQGDLGETPIFFVDAGAKAQTTQKLVCTVLLRRKDVSWSRSFHYLPDGARAPLV